MSLSDMSNHFKDPVPLHSQNLVCSENLRLGTHSSIDLVNQWAIIFASSLCLYVSVKAL